MPRSRALAVLATVAAVALGLDAATKQLALASLREDAPVRLLGGALYLSLTRNSGAAFSIGTGYSFVFPIIAMVVIGGIVWFARNLYSLRWAIAMGLVLGGALGNLTDRLLRAPGPLRGHVVDFLSLFDEAGRVWPIFNVADMALFFGAALAILLEFTGWRRDGGRDVRNRAKQAAPIDDGGAH